MVKRLRVPIGTLIAIAGLALTYKTAGSEELRARLYQPLFNDLTIIKQSTMSLSAEQGPFPKALPDLRNTGALEQLPRSLKNEFLETVARSETLHTNVLNVREIIVREMSARIMELRSPEIDVRWRQYALKILNAPNRGVPDDLTFQFTHEARGPAMDTRTPGRPLIADPGGPTFVVRDWITFPDSLPIIDRLWTSTNYLYFNDQRDGWYYQLTRDDLRRANLDLRALLEPLHAVLMKQQAFQSVQREWPRLQTDITGIEAILRERIRDPKVFSDLWRR